MVPKGTGSHFIELATENGALKGTIHTAGADLVKPDGEGLEVRVGQLCHGVFKFKHSAHVWKNTEFRTDAQAFEEQMSKKRPDILSMIPF
jgi:hypothetical protein